MLTKIEVKTLYNIYGPNNVKNILDKVIKYSKSHKLLGIGQPKLNGSNTSIYTNNYKFIAMNRHRKRFTKFKIQDVSPIYPC